MQFANKPRCYPALITITEQGQQFPTHTSNTIKVIATINYNPIIAVVDTVTSHLNTITTITTINITCLLPHPR